MSQKGCEKWKKTAGGGEVESTRPVLMGLKAGLWIRLVMDSLIFYGFKAQIQFKRFQMRKFEKKEWTTFIDNKYYKM